MNASQSAELFNLLQTLDLDYFQFSLQHWKSRQLTKTFTQEKHHQRIDNWVLEIELERAGFSFVYRVDSVDLPLLKVSLIDICSHDLSQIGSRKPIRRFDQVDFVNCSNSLPQEDNSFFLDFQKILEPVFGNLKFDLASCQTELVRVTSERQRATTKIVYYSAAISICANLKEFNTICEFRLDGISPKELIESIKNYVQYFTKTISVKKCSFLYINENYIKFRPSAMETYVDALICYLRNPNRSSSRIPHSADLLTLRAKLCEIDICCKVLSEYPWGSQQIQHRRLAGR